MRGKKMVKCTSYLISKKLAEIGFKFAHEKAWIKFERQSQPELKTGLTVGEQFSAELIVPAYDLETILDSLPEYVKTDKAYWFEMDKDGLYYYHHTLGDAELLTESMKRKEESLADAAARLLIKLHDAGLVKFEQLTNKEE